MSLLRKYSRIIRVIYALPGGFYKYTIQSMTVECQLNLSRHNSHEITWGHHLQYDRFCTTLSKNRRELRGNNFTDHMTNNWSDDSRSRDFIVVLELRRPFRVLKKSEILGRKCNSKTRAKLKISMPF